MTNAEDLLKDIKKINEAGLNYIKEVDSSISHILNEAESFCSMPISIGGYNPFSEDYTRIGCIANMLNKAKDRLKEKIKEFEG